MELLAGVVVPVDGGSGDWADAALEVKWSDGPFDHPAELKETVNFCERNGLARLYVTTRTQKGVKRSGSVELVYVPSALFALALNGGRVFK